MAITRDSTANGSGTGNFSFNLTIAQANELLLVYLHRNADEADNITYNGVPMTIIGSTGNAGDNYIIFGLLNPATGTNSVALTTNSNASKNAIAVAYKGVSQTSLPSNIVTGSSGAVSVTTTANNSVVGGSSTGTAGSGTTLIGTSGSYSAFESSPLLVNPAGSKTLNFTGGGNCIGVELLQGPIIVSLATGYYTLTGYTTTYLKAHNYVVNAITGYYNLIGFSAFFLRLQQWINQAKHLVSWINQNKS